MFLFLNIMGLIVSRCQFIIEQFTLKRSPSHEEFVDEINEVFLIKHEQHQNNG